MRASESNDRLPVNGGLPHGGRFLFARRLARRAIPGAIRHRLGVWLSEWLTRRSPDRVYLRRVLLPRIACRGGTVLLVGCRRYTARDPCFLQQQGVVCWTLDIDPAAAAWGSPGHHVIAPIEQAACRFDPATFDTVGCSAACSASVWTRSRRRMRRSAGSVAGGWLEHRPRGRSVNARRDRAALQIVGRRRACRSRHLSRRHPRLRLLHPARPGRVNRRCSGGVLTAPVSRRCQTRPL